MKLKFPSAAILISFSCNCCHISQKGIVFQKAQKSKQTFPPGSADHSEKKNPPKDGMRGAKWNFPARKRPEKRGIFEGAESRLEPAAAALKKLPCV